jgi:predicted RNA-binding protein with RPS1 domain
MKNVIAEPRKELSPYAPSIISMRIDPERIGAVIGSGGKVINGIIADTGVITINIEDDGVISIAAIGHEKAEAAKRIIEGILKEYEVGEVVNGKIVKLLDFGAVVDLGGGKDGMVHISEFKHGFVEKISDVAHLGDEVIAQVIRAEQGKLSLSVKALLPKPEGQPKRDELSRPGGQHEGPRPEYGGGRGHDDRRPAGGFGGGSRRPRNEAQEPHREVRSAPREEKAGKTLEEVLKELEGGTTGHEE